MISIGYFLYNRKCVTKCLASGVMALTHFSMLLMGQSKVFRCSMSNIKNLSSVWQELWHNLHCFLLSKWVSEWVGEWVREWVNYVLEWWEDVHRGGGPLNSYEGEEDPPPNKKIIKIKTLHLFWFFSIDILKIQNQMHCFLTKAAMVQN